MESTDRGTRIPIRCRPGLHRVHLLTHPVEGLVVKTALVDAATVPVDRAGAAAVVSMVVSMVTALLVARAVTSPGGCTGRSEADT